MNRAEFIQKHYAPIAGKLQADGYETCLCANGTLSVNKGSKYLGSVGMQYEFYCNSQDLNHPLWIKHIERIMKSIKEANCAQKQAEPKMQTQHETMVME